MSEKNNILLEPGPFANFCDCEPEKGFDKFYIDVSEKKVFKSSGQKDPESGEDLGVIDIKLLLKKVDIKEFLESQAEFVGMDAYIKALALQGDNIDQFATTVDEKINDFSGMPDNLADTLMAGEQAKKAFENLDPALKGSHTTIEGFLSGLTQESVDAYIKGRIEALTPKKEGE